MKMIITVHSSVRIFLAATRFYLLNYNIWSMLKERMYKRPKSKTYTLYYELENALWTNGIDV